MNPSGAKRLRTLKKTKSRNLIQGGGTLHHSQKNRLKKHSLNAGVFGLKRDKLSEKIVLFFCWNLSFLGIMCYTAG